MSSRFRVILDNRTRAVQEHPTIRIVYVAAARDAHASKLAFGSHGPTGPSYSRKLLCSLGIKIDKRCRERVKVPQPGALEFTCMLLVDLHSAEAPGPARRDSTGWAHCTYFQPRLEHCCLSCMASSSRRVSKRACMSSANFWMQQKQAAPSCSLAGFGSLSYFSWNFSKKVL